MFRFLLLFLSLNLFSYPKHWWAYIDDPDKPSWEILPHEAKEGELILSKRNELGVFSNFSHSPFFLDGEYYASVEGFWQMMKYPESKNDIRLEYVYPHSREDVKLMFGFEAKEAGDLANTINKKHGIFWVSYKTHKFNYKDFKQGSHYHYKLIFRAINAKISNNPQAQSLLEETKGLVLKADHYQGDKIPPSYDYPKILMRLRDNLSKD